jgi:hypothetical protein
VSETPEPPTLLDVASALGLQGVLQDLGNAAWSSANELELLLAAWDADVREDEAHPDQPVGPERAEKRRAYVERLRVVYERLRRVGSPTVPTIG